MYYLNKIVGAFLNPLGVGLLLLLASFAAAHWFKHTKARPDVRLSHARALTFSTSLMLLSFLWLWFWSTGAVGRWIGLSLERAFPPQLAETMPTADAIVVLGGGMTVETNACPYADMQGAADRAWHGARLYRAGKASRVFVTCEGDIPLLVDLGVPRTAISGPSGARNTEEEAKFIAGAMKTGTERGVGCRADKVLLVTSAWHMRRAKLMYDRYAKGIEVIPAAADHMCTTGFARPLELKDFVPDSMMLAQNAYLFKEWLAYWGYRFLRK